MTKYVDAEALMETIRSDGDSMIDDMGEHYLERVINTMPAADVELVRHGKWEVKREFQLCTECGYPVIRWNPAKYCPHCGAKIDGGGE